MTHFPIDGALVVYEPKIKALWFMNSFFELLDSLSMYEILDCSAQGVLRLRNEDETYTRHIFTDVSRREEFWLLDTPTGFEVADSFDPKVDSQFLAGHWTGEVYNKATNRWSPGEWIT